MQRCHAIWIYQINSNHLLQKKKNVINKNISNINHEMLRIQILTLSIELYIDTHYLLGQVFFYFFSLTKTQVARERERERERTFRLLRKASCINDANPMHSKQWSAPPFVNSLIT